MTRKRRPRICQFCSQDITARGMCEQHYNRWRNAGKPDLETWNGGPLISTDLDREMYSATMEEFHKYCDDKRIPYMPSIVAAVRKMYTDFNP